MCKFWSCLVTRDKQVVWEPGVDSHDKLVDKYKLRDDTLDGERQAFARVEITPPALFSWCAARWAHRVDEDITPDWYSPAHADAARAVLAEYLPTVQEQFPSTLDLSGATLPEGVTLPQSVGGGLDLRGTTLPEGVTLPQSVGEGLDLSGATLPEGVTLLQAVGGEIYWCG